MQVLIKVSPEERKLITQLATVMGITERDMVRHAINTLAFQKGLRKTIPHADSGRNKFFARDEAANLILTVLQSGNGEPMTTDTLVNQVIKKKGINNAKAAIRSLQVSLYNLLKKGKIRKIESAEGGVGWKVER